MEMNYFVVGTNNFDASTQFYDALFNKAGWKRVYTNERMAYWKDDSGSFTFAVAMPFDKKPATNGNGSMVGFSVASKSEVERHYQQVIALGGLCEGEPNFRGPVYSAYARDLDNNKLSFYWVNQ